jgi:hypothetical protein
MHAGSQLMDGTDGDNLLVRLPGDGDDHFPQILSPLYRAGQAQSSVGPAAMFCRRVCGEAVGLIPEHMTVSCGLSGDVET